MTSNDNDDDDVIEEEEEEEEGDLTNVVNSSKEIDCFFINFLMSESSCLLTSLEPNAKNFLMSLILKILSHTSL